jgi:hypothetical protein
VQALAGGVKTVTEGFDRAIFAAGINGLKNKEQASVVLGIQDLL